MKESAFTIRNISYWCEICEKEAILDFLDEELCARCQHTVTPIIGDEVNPHPSQILTYNRYGEVDGGYDNPKWAKWERDNGR